MYISKKNLFKLLLLLVAICCHPHQATTLTSGNDNKSKLEINTFQRNTLNRLKAAYKNKLDNYDDEQNNSRRDDDDTINFYDYADTQKPDMNYLSYLGVKNTQGQSNNNTHNTHNSTENNDSNNNVLDPDFKKGATEQTYQNALKNIADANDKDKNNSGTQNSSDFTNQDPLTTQIPPSDSTNTTHPNNNKDVGVTTPQDTILNQVQNIGFADLFFTLFFLGLIVSALVIVIQKLKK